MDPNTGAPLMRDETPMVMPPAGTPGYVPTMSKDQFEAFAASQAQLQAARNLNPLLQHAVKDALSK